MPTLSNHMFCVKTNPSCETAKSPTIFGVKPHHRIADQFALTMTVSFRLSPPEVLYRASQKYNRRGSPFALLAECAEHKGQAQEPGNPTINLRHGSELDAYNAISEMPNT
jgi:hypothetical protein